MLIIDSELSDAASDVVDANHTHFLTNIVRTIYWCANALPTTKPNLKELTTEREKMTVFRVSMLVF